MAFNVGQMKRQAGLLQEAPMVRRKSQHLLLLTLQQAGFLHHI
jgi:hypothetical protein